MSAEKADTIEIAEAPVQRSTLFGHPRGLTFLFATEMWERFSYYGMKSLLLLYMIDFLLKPDVASNILGVSRLRGWLEAVSGPLENQAVASQVYGLYSGLLYLTPILGGLLADRIVGRTPTILAGGLVMVAGHFLMASDRLFLIALLLLIIGNGMFKPNISTQVGELYVAGDRRVDRGYSIFYVGINIGAFFAPLVCGFLGERIAWHYGFIAAGFGMAIGTATYLAGLRSLPKSSALSPSEPVEAKPGQFRAALLSVLILLVPSALFWAAYEQQGNAITLWLKQSIDRTVNLHFWAGEIPVTWFQAINPIMIFTLTPFVIASWAYLSKAGREPTTIGKLSFGCLLLALAYLLLAGVAQFSSPQGISWVWLLPFFVLLTVGELHFSPIGLSLVSSLAPHGSRSSLMATWFIGIFAGNFLAGWLGSLWAQFATANYFLMMAILSALASAMIAAVRPLLNRRVLQ
jgi:POT family proton-dependent oligopeptide transporter